MSDIELLAPAGSWEALEAAIQNGADAVYFGMGALNMRTHTGHNFTLEDLPTIVKRCNKDGVRSYVTLNSIMYDEDLNLMRETCQAVKEAGATAVIASDIAAIQYARSIGLHVHISTQANISNIEAVRFFAQFADVVVLARELTLEQITAICTAIKEEKIVGPSGELIRTELFVHGALCVSISGKCYMSLSNHAKSANRGACLQSCRRRYRVIDEETNHELVLENKYVMSPKDLSTIRFLDQILASGVSVLKLEGRGRSPEYVATVTKTYREAVDAIRSDTYTQDKIEAWNEALKTVYNRGFWEGGYYLGKTLGEWSGTHGSQATQRKTYIGKVTNYFSNKQVVEVKLESHSVKVGDKVLITGPTTGVLEGIIESLHTHGPVESAEKGALIAFPFKTKVRRSDRLYLVEARS